MNNNISCIGDKCCGCGLCSIKCPFGAIEMKYDNEGFIYPYINKNKCKNCGICLKNCIIKKKNELDNNYKNKCMMVISKDKYIYNNSASGGFATVLSKCIIDNYHGIVYGCSLNNNGEVKHIRIDNSNDLYKLQDSKYVQSNILNVFKLINEDIVENVVLFVGTPCQVNAIKNSVPKKYINNLVTCDLICHGVPSPLFFKKHFNLLKKKYKSNNIEYRFRNKTSFDKCGFRGRLKINNKVKYFFIEDDKYYNDFINEKNYRKSCYQCCYKETNRLGDFTIGDVNSWELYYDFYPELDPSLVIINSSNAEKIFGELSDLIMFKEISLDKEKELNKALSYQTPYPKNRDNIYFEYENNKLLDSRCHIKASSKIKRFLKIIIPFKVRIKLKKIRRSK